MSPGPPPGPLRALVGVAEVADLLGVSRQRADALTRTKGFPEPVTAVAPWDEASRQTLTDLDEANALPLSLTDVITYMDEHVFRLPDTPRLWRREAVVEWAETTGRYVHDDDTADTEAPPVDLRPAANHEPTARKRKG
jgi:hypothetical protein